MFLFSGGVVGFMEGFGSSGLRSLCSNMVTVNEQGKIRNRSLHVQAYK